MSSQHASDDDHANSIALWMLFSLTVVGVLIAAVGALAGEPKALWLSGLIISIGVAARWLLQVADQGDP